MRRTTCGMVIASGSPRKASSSPVGIKRGRRSEHHGELTTLSYMVSVVASIVMSAMLSFVMSAVVSVTVSAVVSTGSVGWGLRRAREREGRLTIGMQFGGELLTRHVAAPILVHRLEERVHLWGRDRDRAPW
jgi:hypothetical protein